MTFLKSLIIESKKHRQRHHLLILLGFLMAEFLFIFLNYRDDKGLTDGWLILFYNMPIMNTLFLPVLLSAFASRLMDIEHKGDMMKILYTFASPRKLFFTKLIYGLIHVGMLALLQGAAILIIMKILDYPIHFPVKYMLYYECSLFLSSALLFALHLLLAYFFRNQAVSISVGLIGSFMGLFLAYLPASLLQRTLPWSTFINALFVYMDWNRHTREIKWILLKPSISAILISLFWISVFLGISLLLLKKCGVEESSDRKKKGDNAKQNRIHRIPIEVMKLKASPAWFGFFLIPVISAIIGTINYLGNLEILKDGWFSLWTQHTLFLCYFFMPVIIAVFTGCIWRAEHNGTNMSLLLTHASPLRIVMSKYGASLFITILSLIWIAALYIASGLICRIEGSVPSELLLWFLYGLIGAASICALQLFISLIIRNFVLPLILAFIGGLGGLACIAKRIPYVLPYSLFQLAMTENNQNIKILPFLFSACLFTGGFLALSVLYLKKSDVRSHT